MRKTILILSLAIGLTATAQEDKKEGSHQDKKDLDIKKEKAGNEDSKDAGPEKMKDRKFETKKNYVIRVHGKVQNVTFRNSAKQQAKSLGLTGMARNEKDGTVYIEVEGDKRSIDKFIEWCHRGPEEAEVEKVEALPGIVKDYKEFDVDRLSKK